MRRTPIRFQSADRFQPANAAPRQLRLPSAPHKAASFKQERHVRLHQQIATGVLLLAACGSPETSSSPPGSGTSPENAANASTDNSGMLTGGGASANTGVDSPNTGGQQPGSEAQTQGMANTGSASVNGDVAPPKAPELGIGVGVVEQCTDENAIGPTPIRRLSTIEYYNAVKDALGTLVSRGDLPADEKHGTFTSNVTTPLVQDNFSRYLFLADQVASDVIADFATRSGCSSTADAACTQDFLTSKARQLFHGTLDPADQTRLLDLYSSLSTETDPDLAAQTALSWILTSPRFLFLVEFGQGGTGEQGGAGEQGSAGVSKLTASEVAGRLAAFLWRSVPDANLLAAADSGALDTAEGIRAQADAMLNDERAQTVLKSFAAEWLRIAPASPDASPLEQQIRTQAGDVLAGAASDASLAFPDLLTKDFSATAGAELSAFYGDNPRAGLLSSAGFLASNSSGLFPSPVKRGFIVRSSLLCQPIPPPTDPTAMQLPEPVDGVSTQQVFNAHSSTPECWACHQLMDPIGDAFGTYDFDGSYNPSLTDTTAGVVYGGEPFNFADTQELLAYLASNDTAQDCFAIQMTRFALGRGETTQDACALKDLTSNFRTANFSLRELLVEITASQMFLNRNPVVAQGACR